MLATATPDTGTGTGIGAWRRDPGTVVLAGEDLPQGATEASVIVAQAHAPSMPLEWEPHSHTMHELVWVRGGTLVSRVQDRIFTLSPGQGLWMPAGLSHAGRLTAGVSFYCAYFAPEHTPVAFEAPTAIEMTPVLESLLTHLTRTDLDAEARARAEAVVFDVLQPSQHQPALQLPGDPRIDAIAAALLEDPGDERSLEDWAHQLGTSDRTITRAFRQATGLSFAQWRQALRVHEALALLSEGTEVGAVAQILGYAQASTFIAAFRRVMGTTPGAYPVGTGQGGH